MNILHPVVDTLKNFSYTVIDCVRPKNIVTGHREFHFIPACVENLYGRLVYPIAIFSDGGAVLETNTILNSDNIVQRVKAVGKRLAEQSKSQLDFQFTVINSAEKNAWCLPGGKIGINLGLLRDLDDIKPQDLSLDDKIAAVLSHEITHALARHSVKQLTFSLFLKSIVTVTRIVIEILFEKKDCDESQADRATRHTLKKWTVKIFTYSSRLAVLILSNCHSQQSELEADKYGMNLMCESGYNCRAAVWLQIYFRDTSPTTTGIEWFDRLSGYFNTHPCTEARIEANKTTYRELHPA